MKKFTSITIILLSAASMAFGQWTFTNLSSPRKWMGVASSDTKAYFAGGFNGSATVPLVESYDVETGTWENTGYLSVSRQVIAGTACGSKLFFGGGVNSNMNVVYSTVDIYDIASGQWITSQLSIARFDISAVSYQDKVLFAGGCNYSIVCTSVVDVYDVTTGTWSALNLSSARAGMASAVVGDLAVFAGGFTDGGNVSDQVDIYNFTTNTWTSATLSEARVWATAATLGTKVFIAGGIKYFPGSPSNTIDIFDASTGNWTTEILFEPRAWIAGGAVNGKVFFAGGANVANGGVASDFSNIVDFYDEATGTWSVDVLAQPRFSQGVVAGDYFLVAGGESDAGLLSSVEILHVPYVPHIIHVPGDYPSIQEGINAASPGDTVLVADSLYYENITFLGKKPLLVASHFIMDGDTSHINNTIINGSQPVNPDIGAVVAFASGEDTTSVLCGFTITGGTGTDIPGVVRMGGGIFLTESGGKLLNNHIEYNSTKGEGWSVGGGIGAGGPISPLPWVVLRNNRINNNEAESTANDRGEGGGVLCFYNLVMTDNVVSDNKATGGYGGLGGGVYIRGDFGTSWFNFSRNILTNNKAIANSSNSLFSLGGGFVIYQSYGIAAGNLFASNVTESPLGIDAAGSGVYIEGVPDSDLVFENNKILNNSFIGDVCFGGGLCLWNNGGTYQNNVIQSNKATKGGGISIGSSPSDTAIFINNTITGNDASGGGTGLHISFSNAVIINSILYNNTPPGPAIFAESSNLEVRYSDVDYDEFVYPGEGNVNCDPTFLEDGYHLDPSCQLLNAGITTIEVNGVWYNCPALDIDGEPRPFAGTQPEIGVDELQITVPSVKPVSSADITVNIFPNPANRMVTISAESGSAITRVTIYDTQGQPVYTGIPINDMLDVSNLLPGVYILEALCGEKESRQKLIIK